MPLISKSVFKVIWPNARTHSIITEKIGTKKRVVIDVLGKNTEIMYAMARKMRSVERNEKWWLKSIKIMCK